MLPATRRLLLTEPRSVRILLSNSHSVGGGSVCFKSLLVNNMYNLRIPTSKPRLARLKLVVNAYLKVPFGFPIVLNR